MTEVAVQPQEWRNVFFDSDRIGAVAARLAGEIGIDGPVEIEVDETMPTGRVTVRSVDPVRIHAESGAFEDPKRPRQLSEEATADVLGRLLFRIADRRSPGFSDAPPDDELTLPQSSAWDAYAVGRMARLGYPVNRQRRLYHFRTRHGFSDVTDAAFDRLWTGSELTWEDIDGICRETEAARAAA
jgi:hypothetical protein